MLKEFLFPVLLTLAGTMPGIAAGYADGITRKWLWTVTLVFWFAAGLSYIWGDPVRGPFYGLLQQKASEEFSLHAGINAKFPIRQLSAGIDFSRVVDMDMGGINPIKLKVSRTWWAGWKYDVRVEVLPGKHITLTNDAITGIPIGWDFNGDEDAVEIVNAHEEPVFQLIQSSDYDIYVNAFLKGKQDFTIMNGARLLFRVDEVTAMEHRLRPIFRYPRYINRGIRK